ncbi:DNA/RNA nuclease SfsA [Marinobacterium sediminicola]|uniref:Sugar fermentation stimulation protein homolog n=1 Tax=Marinobacterium sediminicola TaxID=518898 RepID=A0ABY1RYM4_9GAMM|nr:DNA/RNA nuclease SfsA [Marinobacterium sediminicola]ULG68054.1 DNA/RNA nuclease SfsA [Marinobacterium sediminicola]SMR73436.1 sugar fermentation stimulation protein A [Marinobacterium sediminicola]
MKFDPPLETVTLLKRYKRFMADVRHEDGSEMTVHCPNTGSMKNCVLPGVLQPALISDSGNPKRKYRHTLEAVQVAHGHWAGVNTGRTNALVEEAIRAGLIHELSPASGVEREVQYGDSRFDLALGSRAEPHTFIEVKNVTLGPGPEDEDDGIIAFPDSVTERGQKHLRTLIQVAAEGRTAVLLFCVQHSGARAARPADEVDACYGQLLRQAAQAGVKVMAWKVRIGPDSFTLEKPIPVLL